MVLPPTIEETTDLLCPVVGKVYLRPSVDGVPILGKPHADFDYLIAVPSHWHVDTRFCEFDKDKVLRHHSDQYIEYREFTCLRSEVLPLDTRRMLAALNIAFAGQPTKCGKCPHRGLPVINGRCAGHGLCFMEDGSPKYKAPFTLWLGLNKLEGLDTWQGHFEIPISFSESGPILAKVTDARGNLVTQWIEYLSAISPVEPGDLYIMGSTSYSRKA